MYIKQGLIIDNLRLGIKTDVLDIGLTETDFVEFGNNFNTANTVMVRPDIWVLPFLNLYGLFGTGTSKTEVNLKFPVELQSIVEQNVRTSGFGATAAGGLGPVWLAIDANVTWNKPELLDDPVKVKTFGVRFGHNFVHKSKPYRNIGIWVGAMKVSLGSNTVGELKLKDALPEETWDRADQIVAAYDDWYNNTATIPQKVIADQTLGPLIDAIDNADGEAIIRYGIDKRAKQEWNGIIGAQYQPNKNWMFRTEAGIVGDRKSLLLSLNWRFLI
jgi:opacity protein-like surface antigen